MHKHTLSHIHTTLLFQNTIKDKTLKHGTCIRISDIIYNPYITRRTIKSYTQTETHTLPYTYFSEKEEQKKTCNRKQTGIGISNIIYNPYITGMTFNSYTETHTHLPTHTIPKKNKRKQTKFEEEKTYYNQ